MGVATTQPKFKIMDKKLESYPPSKSIPAQLKHLCNLVPAPLFLHISGTLFSLIFCSGILGLFGATFQYIWCKFSITSIKTAPSNGTVYFATSPKSRQKMLKINAQLQLFYYK